VIDYDADTELCCTCQKVMPTVASTPQVPGVTPPPGSTYNTDSLRFCRQCCCRKVCCIPKDRTKVHVKAEVEGDSLTSVETARREAFECIFNAVSCCCVSNLLYVPIYASLQTFIQLSLTVTNLCRIKCDHPANFFSFH